MSTKLQASLLSRVGRGEPNHNCRLYSAHAHILLAILTIFRTTPSHAAPTTPLVGAAPSETGVERSDIVVDQPVRASGLSVVEKGDASTADAIDSKDFRSPSFFLPSFSSFSRDPNDPKPRHANASHVGDPRGDDLRDPADPSSLFPADPAAPAPSFPDPLIPAPLSPLVPAPRPPRDPATPSFARDGFANVTSPNPSSRARFVSAAASPASKVTSDAATPDSRGSKPNDAAEANDVGSKGAGQGSAGVDAGSLGAEVGSLGADVGSLDAHFGSPIAAKASTSAEESVENAEAKSVDSEDDESALSVVVETSVGRDDNPSKTKGDSTKPDEISQDATQKSIESFATIEDELEGEAIADVDRPLHRQDVDAESLSPLLVLPVKNSDDPNSPTKNSGEKKKDAKLADAKESDAAMKDAPAPRHRKRSAGAKTGVKSKAENVLERVVTETTSVTLECSSPSRKAIWTKILRGGKIQYLFVGVDPAVESVNRSKYAVHRRGNNFNLVIFGAELDDAGKYDCSGGAAYHLTVVTAPRCRGDVQRLQEGVVAEFTCDADVRSGEEEERSTSSASSSTASSSSSSSSVTSSRSSTHSALIKWRLRGWQENPQHLTKSGKITFNERGSLTSGHVTSTLRMAPSFSDHGRALGCQVLHPRWNLTHQAPACQFQPLQIRFSPKLICPSQQLLLMNLSSYNIGCSIVAHPMPSVKHLFWKMANGDFVYFDPSSVDQKIIKQSPTKMTAMLRLKEEQLNTHMPSIEVSLQVARVPGTYATQGRYEGVSKTIKAVLVIGPNIQCPTLVRVMTTSAEVVIACDIMVHPMVDPQNITWSLQRPFSDSSSSSSSSSLVASKTKGVSSGENGGDDGARRGRWRVFHQDGDMLSRIHGGVRAKIVLDANELNEAFRTQQQNKQNSAAASAASASASEDAATRSTPRSLVLLLTVKGVVKEARSHVTLLLDQTALMATTTPDDDFLQWINRHTGALIVVFATVLVIVIIIAGILFRHHFKKSNFLGATSLHSEMDYSFDVAAFGSRLQLPGQKIGGVSGLGAPPSAPSGLAAPASGGAGSMGVSPSGGGAPMSPPSGPNEGNYANHLTLSGSFTNLNVASRGVYSLDDAAIASGVASGASSSASISWATGFTKMANAILLRDADNDGYVAVDKIVDVVRSYNEIYQLGITDKILEESLKSCSNGIHADVETLLRILTANTTPADFNNA